MQKILFEIWSVATILALVIILFLRHRRTKKWKIDLDSIIEIALGIWAGVSGAYLIYQIYDLHDSLYKLVGNEGLVAMFIGGVASIWFVFSSFKKIIEKP
jgi:hypothetical protein